MGGSGGGYFSRAGTPADLARRTRDAEDQARSHAFDTDVAGFLSTLLTQYNDRDAEATQGILRDICAELSIEGDKRIETLFGGSVAKHTYVDGISDIDALLLVDQTELANRSPSELISWLAGRLRRYYGPESVRSSKLAVTVTVRDLSVQILPALRRGEQFAIAAARGDGWSRIDPQRFARSLTEANKRLGGKLVPCIKLIKGLMAKLPEKRQLTGYHTEALAIEVFRSYGGTQTTKAMLRHFFENAGDHVAHKISDTSGQSRFVDAYLGETGSVKRRIVADALNRVGRQIKNADGSQSVNSWRILFE